MSLRARFDIFSGPSLVPEFATTVRVCARTNTRLWSLLASSRQHLLPYLLVASLRNPEGPESPTATLSNLQARMSGKVAKPHDDAAFDELFERAAKAGQMMVVDFSMNGFVA